LILHTFIIMIDLDEFYMRKALIEAEQGFLKDEVPVGSVIVYNNKIIAKAHNMCMTLCDPTAHAEMQVITSACNYLESRYLEKCALYTTLEPCCMCSGALFWSKIGAVIYAADDEKQGFSMMKKNILHPKTNIRKGILKYDAGDLLTKFFKKKRNLKKKK